MKIGQLVRRFLRPPDRGALTALFGVLPVGLLLRLAAALAEISTPAPYPGWRFGIGEEESGFKTRIRLLLWAEFHRRKIARPLRCNWHEGLKLYLWLGNDLSRCLFVSGSYEPNELALLGRVLKPGMVFVDAGANEGIYTVFASRQVGAAGRVLVFEPSKRELARLRENISLNALTNVEIFPFALGAEPGKAKLKVAGYEHEGQNTFGEFIYDGVLLSHVEEADIAPLDTVVTERTLPRVDAIKIDTEGSEHAILQGAEKVLQRDRPLLILELVDKTLAHQGSSATDVLQFLTERGYEIYRFSERTGLPEPARLGGALSPNIVAIHHERFFAGALG